MITDYKIQQTGQYTYPGLDKPVLFSPQFLAGLAKDGTYHLELEHNGPHLGEAEGLYFKDGALYMKTKDLNHDKVKGKGFSTVITDYNLVDKGDYYEVISGVLKRIALTSNPKDVSTILYNSDNPQIIPEPTQNNNNNDSEGEAMTEELRNENKRLEQEIGGLKHQLNLYIDEIKQLKDSKVALETDKQGLLDEKETLTTKLTTFETSRKKYQETLAKELAGEDEELFEAYKDTPISKLKVIKTKLEDKINQGFRGRGDSDPPGPDTNHDGGGDDTPLSYAEWEKKRGIW